MKLLRSLSPPLQASALLGLAALALWILPPRTRAEEPPVFAITNARIIPVSGAPIEKGTVVIRRGIIESVGATVAIPGDARIIDAAGMTLYPGLIDSLSDVGLEEAQPQAPARGPAVPGPPSAPPAQATTQSPDEGQGLTPYRLAVELLNPANRKIESARAAGITTAVVAPRRGIFAGQSALLNLSGGDLGRMVVKTPVFHHINPASRGRSGQGYPTAPMGVFAFVKQTLLDAQRYSLVWGIYNSNPGTVRPEYSRALEALQPLIRQEVPVVLPGDDPTEIGRMLDLAEAYKLQLVLSGAADAGKIATVLRDRGVPVLLSVRFPERERDADPEAREELDQLRRRVEAPANAAALAKAGVKFAFQSGDTANPRDFLRNVIRAVDAGLDKDVALRALTLTAAEILGVADRFGSIERNKTANLVLATGDLFNPATRVKTVFVDGRKFEIAETEAAPATSPGAPSEGMESLSGTWTLTVESPQGAIAATLSLRQSGAEVTGEITSPMGTADISEGRFAGNRLSFRVSAGGMDVRFAATIQGSSMTGNVSAGSMGTMNFTGSRSPREL